MAPTSLPWHQTSPAHTVTGLHTIVPDDVDLGAIERGLADDHVDAPAEVTPGLADVVAKAKGEGHDMYFVVLTETQPKFTYYRDIATALQEKTGGTVVVFGPNTLGTASDDFSRVQLEQAQDNLSVANPTAAADTLLDRMTDQTQVPWTVVTVLLVVAVAIGAVAARVIGRRRSAGSAPRPAPVTASAPGDPADPKASTPEA
ncbi:Rv1476 family membrane protein [Williamsia sp. MIQD14]|uniref:Rv1476 family membrane protein n=1 Tax=Williamsia sp. MIQD14 TaxID=3425703 RepID=UPI003D9FBE92